MRYEVVHEDLAAFYASRITTRDAGNFGIFHTYSENIAFVDSLRLLYPQIVSAKWSIGLTVQGRNIWASGSRTIPTSTRTNPRSCSTACTTPARS